MSIASTLASTTAGTYNPFADVVPGFGPFQSVLGPKVGIVIGLIWAVGFVVLAVYLIEGIVRMGKAKRAGYADAYEEAKGGLAWPVGGIVLLAIIPLLFTILTA